MSSYTQPLKISYHNTASKLLGKDYWVVMSPFRYYIGKENSHEYVDIPLGFLTDGASVPRLFWNILPPWGKYGQATVVHDWLCEHGQIVSDGKVIDITRKQTDRIFKEAMQVLQVPAWKIWAMSSAVAMYRNITRKSEPKLPEQKIMVEQMIRENAQFGLFELTDEQIKEVQNEYTNH